MTTMAQQEQHSRILIKLVFGYFESFFKLKAFYLKPIFKIYKTYMSKIECKTLGGETNWKPS